MLEQAKINFEKSGHNFYESMTSNNFQKAFEEHLPEMRRNFDIIRNFSYLKEVRKYIKRNEERFNYSL